MQSPELPLPPLVTLPQKRRCKSPAPVELSAELLYELSRPSTRRIPRSGEFRPKWRDPY